MERFINWMFEIRPTWVGFVVGISVCCAIFISIMMLITLTNGIILLAVPIVIVYAWYIALFKQ